MTRQELPQNYQIQEGTRIEDFSTVDGWSLSGATLDVAPTYGIAGSGAHKLTATVGTTTPRATKTVSLDLGQTGAWSVWVYVPPATGPLINSFDLYLASVSTFAKYAYIQPGELHEYWNALPMARSVFSLSGGESWANTMVRLRYRASLVGASADASEHIYVSDLRVSRYNRPKAIFTFDDGNATDLTVAQPALAAYGWVGTTFAVPEWIGGSNRLSLAQAQTLYAAGWDISSHTYDHSDLTTKTKAEITTNLSAARDWLVAQGFTRRNCHLMLGHTYGNYNTDVLDVMQEIGLIAGRSSWTRVQANVLDEPRLLVSRPVSGSDSALALTAIDRAISTGGCVTFLLHRLVAADPNGGAGELTIAAFDKIVSYLAARRHLIDVVSLSQWYEGLTRPRLLTNAPRGTR